MTNQNLRKIFLDSLSTFVCSRLGRYTITKTNKNHIRGHINMMIDIVEQVSYCNLSYFTGDMIHRIIKEFIILDQNYDYDDGVWVDLLQEGEEYFKTLCAPPSTN
jgi:hypothetical protein